MVPHANVKIKFNIMAIFLKLRYKINNPKNTPPKIYQDFKYKPAIADNIIISQVNTFILYATI